MFRPGEAVKSAFGTSNDASGLSGPEAPNHWQLKGAETMRGIILWLLGVPLIVIIFLYLFHVI